MAKERVYAVTVTQPVYRTHWLWARNAKEARDKISAMIHNEDVDLLESIGHSEGPERITNVTRSNYYGGDRDQRAATPPSTEAPERKES